MTLSLTEQTHAPAPAEAAGQLRRFLRPQEIRRATGLPEAVLYDALSSGDLPALDISRPALPGKTRKPVYMVDPLDFEAWLQRRKDRQGAK